MWSIYIYIYILNKIRCLRKRIPKKRKKKGGKEKYRPYIFVSNQESAFHKIFKNLAKSQV